MATPPEWLDDEGEHRSEPIAADWWFTHAAYDALKAHLPSLDADASRLVMRLRRATGITANYLRGDDSRIVSAAGQRILLTLLLTGPLTQSQIASLSGMSRAAVSSAVRTLVVDRMVDREPSTTDRRAIYHSISDYGREQYTALFKSRNARENNLLSTLSSEEQKQLLRILEKIVTFASRHVESDQLLTSELLRLQSVQKLRSPSSSQEQL